MHPKRYFDDLMISILQSSHKVADFLMQVIKEFARLGVLATANNMPVVPTPQVSMVTSFLSYHRLKERGGQLVGGQSLEDIDGFVQQHLLTDESPKNLGGCVHLASDKLREDPFFALLLSTRGLLDSMDLTCPIEMDETYKLIYEGYPVTLIGQSDMNRKFHVR